MGADVGLMQVNTDGKTASPHQPSVTWLTAGRDSTHTHTHTQSLSSNNKPQPYN